MNTTLLSTKMVPTGGSLNNLYTFFFFKVQYCHNKIIMQKKYIIQLLV